MAKNKANSVDGVSDCIFSRQTWREMATRTFEDLYGEDRVEGVEPIIKSMV